jgi:acetoin utilization protein AcuB
MLVRQIMTFNVITIPSETLVLDAERVMEFHKIGRLPVVDKGKLVGIVTKDDVIKANPSSTTPLDQRQLFHLLAKLTVGEVMKKNVVTTTPDTTIEKAVAIAQKNRIGCLPVVEGDHMIGMITTNDVFYKILNPLFGIRENGKRVIINGAGNVEPMQKILDVVKEMGLEVRHIWVQKDEEQDDLILHFNTEDVSAFLGRMKLLGFSALEREFAA